MKAERIERVLAVTVDVIGDGIRFVELYIGAEYEDRIETIFSTTLN